MRARALSVSRISSPRRSRGSGVRCSAPRSVSRRRTCTAVVSSTEAPGQGPQNERLVVVQDVYERVLTWGDVCSHEALPESGVHLPGSAESEARMVEGCTHAGVQLACLVLDHRRRPFMSTPVGNVGPQGYHLLRFPLRLAVRGGVRRPPSSVERCTRPRPHPAARRERTRRRPSRGSESTATRSRASSERVTSVMVPLSAAIRSATPMWSSPGSIITATSAA